jgi:hypothetical protein
VPGGDLMLFQRFCVGAFQTIDLGQETADPASKISQLNVLAFDERLFFSELPLQIGDPGIKDRFRLMCTIGQDFKSAFFFLQLGV